MKSTKIVGKKECTSKHVFFLFLVIYISCPKQFKNAIINEKFLFSPRSSSDTLNTQGFPKYWCDDKLLCLQNFTKFLPVVNMSLTCQQYFRLKYKQKCHFWSKGSSLRHLSKNCQKRTKKAFRGQVFWK